MGLYQTKTGASKLGKVVESIPGWLALQRSQSHLTQYEKLEIVNYDEVYFVGKGISKPRELHDRSISPTGLKSKFTDAKGHYSILPGDHVGYRYEMLRFLGNGSFGCVYKAKDWATGEQVAMKICVRKNPVNHEAQHEAHMMRYLQNSEKFPVGIARMYGSFEFRGHLVIISELLGMDLYEHLRVLRFRGCRAHFVKSVGLQLFECISFLHKNNVVHCDIKPENVLLSGLGSSFVKVIDFGSSCFVGEPVYGYVQSRYYRAPEVILGISYGPEIDVWSLATVLFEIATGRPLFAGQNNGQQLAVIASLLGPVPDTLITHSIKRDAYFLPESNEFLSNCIPSGAGIYKLHKEGTQLRDLLGPGSSEEFADLLSRCLKWNPKDRITPDEALSHPWFGAGFKCCVNASRPVQSHNVDLGDCASCDHG